MDIKILIDYGQGYSVFLTTKDARYLYDQLAAMFEPAKSLVDPYFTPTIVPNPLMDPNSWNVTCNTGLVSPAAMALKGVVDTSIAGKIHAEMDKQESIEAHDEDCGCNDCYVHAYLKQQKEKKGAQ